MWMVSNSSSNAARGEPNAPQIKNSPRRKLPARQAGITFTAAERMCRHPRTYTNPARVIHNVSETGNVHDCNASCTGDGMDALRPRGGKGFAALSEDRAT